MIDISATVCTDYSAPKLVELALLLGEGRLTDVGALAVTTGKRTGRSPRDRFIVRDETTERAVHWDEINQPWEKERFQALWQRAERQVKASRHFVMHLHAGADPEHYLPLETVTDTAWQALFSRNMFERVAEFNPKGRALWRLLSVSRFECEPARDGTNSDGVVAIDFSARKVLLCGMRYGGEIKKAMFSVQNFLLTDSDVLPMHCAANVSSAGFVTLLFGLSGTGKTTLSADPHRCLVGDDEHGWAPGKVFNLEGGCYAKCIDLDRRREPVIWDAIRYGAILENVVIDKETRTPDYADSSLTENTRCCYPREHIALRSIENRAGEPKAVIFLTCDVTGVLPPVSVLSPAAAAYHFLSGYTARVGSTEVGAPGGVHATFSTCFGKPFFPRPSSVYADLLVKRITSDDVSVYLVNTGWSGGGGGPGGDGQRMPIAATRAIVQAVQSCDLSSGPLRRLPGLNLDVPVAVPGVESSILTPRETWRDSDAYDRAAERLIAQFQKNFERFDGGEASYRDAGPGGG